MKEHGNIFNRTKLEVEYLKSTVACCKLRMGKSRWVSDMVSPKKTLLVEQISYAEEALRRLKLQLHDLFKDIESEYERVFEELKKLEEKEAVVDEKTFDRVNQILQDAWTEAMSARVRLQDLDEDLHHVDTIMAKVLAKLRARRT